MFNRRKGTWSDRNEWTAEQEQFPGILGRHDFTSMLEARQPKGILLEARREGGDFPGLEKGYDNLIDKRQRTFGESLLAELSKDKRTPRDEKTGLPISMQYIPRDPKTEGREL